MQRLEVSGVVRHIYVIRRLKVKSHLLTMTREGNELTASRSSRLTRVTHWTDESNAQPIRKRQRREYIWPCRKSKAGHLARRNSLSRLLCGHYYTQTIRRNVGRYAAQTADCSTYYIQFCRYSVLGWQSNFYRLRVNLHSTMATALNLGSTGPRESVNLHGGKTTTLFSLT